MQAFVRSPEETLLSDAFGGIVSIGVTPGTGAGADNLVDDEANHTTIHPWCFTVTTKVRSLKPEAKTRVDKALADSIEKGVPLSAHQGTYRASDYVYTTYEVVRALNHFAVFCEQFKKREPFSLVGELPTGNNDRRRHEVLNDCDYILSLLLFMISSDKTNNDPLLWSLLTTPNEEYQQQFEGGTLAVAPTITALQDQIQASKLSKLRMDGGVKPESLSKKMVQSGMSDRAFFSCDKFNAFVNATADMEKIRTQDAAKRIRHWDYALSAAADLHRSCTVLGHSYNNMAVALRRSTRPNYWPFRHPDPVTKKIALEPVGASLSRWELRIANLCDSAAANVQSTLTSDIVQDLVVQSLYNNALESSAVHSEAALMCNPQESLAARAVGKVETALLNLLQYGDGGIDSLDKLEQLDDDIGVLHDAVDATTEAFKSHAEEIQAANRERLRQHLEEVVVNQKLQWDLFTITMGDLQKSLEEDEEFNSLLDDELPIFAMNPIPEHRLAQHRQQLQQGQQQQRSASPFGGGRSASPVNKRDSSSPSSPPLQPVVSPSMAATSKAPTSPTTVPKTGINNMTVNETAAKKKSGFSFNSLLGGGSGKKVQTFRSPHRGPTAPVIGGADLTLENPFDVPILMDDHLQGADDLSSTGTEMTEVLSRPSWKTLYEHDRGRKPAPDDPFKPEPVVRQQAQPPAKHHLKLKQ